MGTPLADMLWLAFSTKSSKVATMGSPARGELQSTKSIA